MIKPAVGIDVRMMHYTGIGTYVRGLLQGLTESTHSASVALYGKSSAGDTTFSTPIIDFAPPIYSLTEQMFYPAVISEVKLWHAPHYNIPWFLGKTRLVVTVHDLIHWIFRDRFFNPLKAFYAQMLITRAVDKADHLITVSEHTKSDLIEQFGANPDKITVTYEGVSADFKPSDNTSLIREHLINLGLHKPYFLYVGLMKPHKNVHWLIDVFSRLRSRGLIHSDLVLVGNRDKGYPGNLDKILRNAPNSGIHHLRAISRDDLVNLYRGAIALVHPSIYEGFGLTLLEAMASGTPVIAHRVASIPEVVGQAGHLIDLQDSNALARALMRFESEPDLRSFYTAKGFEQVKMFSWRKMAEQTAVIYDKVLCRP